MGFISNLIKTGLVLGTAYTAYQASEKTKKKGSFKTEEFVRNFKDQAIVNSKLVVNSIKSTLNKQDGEYRVSDEGENGYTYVDGEPAGDKVSEVFETVKEKAPEVLETMKEKAPEVIGKVQDFVEHVRENAPEYKAKAQEFV